MDRVYAIRTPEMVRFEFRLAGLGSRFLAWSIDMALIGVALLVVFVLGLIVSAIWAGVFGSDVGFALLMLALFTIYYGYFVFFEWKWSGRTPGKSYIGLRVMQDNGTRIAPFQAIARNLLRIFDSLVALYGVGAAVAGTGARGQRLGDLVAGTIVVRDDREAALPKVKTLADERQNAFLEDPGLARRLRRLSKTERELLFDAARRADEIELAVRGPLFERLARHFAGRLEIARDPHLSHEKTIQNLARAALAAERSEGAS